MANVYIALGANIGEKKKNLKEAISLLEKFEDVEIKKVSSFYETKPVGGPPQEKYLNGVLEIQTNIAPERLLGILKRIEKDMGRVPAGKNAPRIIDMDILIYGDIVIRTKKLIVPHPSMHERSFVLRGFNEIAPLVVHPVLKKSIKELYKNVRG